jgi:hypothetical protein
LDARLPRHGRPPLKGRKLLTPAEIAVSATFRHCQPEWPPEITKVEVERKCGRFALARSLREGPKDEADLVAEKLLLGEPGELTGDIPREEARPRFGSVTFSSRISKRRRNMRR